MTITTKTQEVMENGKVIKTNYLIVITSKKGTTLTIFSGKGNVDKLKQMEKEK